jgi:hypothetical protein
MRGGQGCVGQGGVTGTHRGGLASTRQRKWLHVAEMAAKVLRWPTANRCNSCSPEKEIGRWGMSYIEEKEQESHGGGSH